MKRIIIIGILAGMLVACNTNEDAPVSVPDGKVQVEFQLPGTYGISISDAQSRAVDNLGPNDWHDLPQLIVRRQHLMAQLCQTE